MKLTETNDFQRDSIVMDEYSNKFTSRNDRQFHDSPTESNASLYATIAKKLEGCLIFMRER